MNGRLRTGTRPRAPWTAEVLCKSSRAGFYAYDAMVFEARNAQISPVALSIYAVVSGRENIETRTSGRTTVAHRQTRLSTLQSCSRSLEAFSEANHH